MGKAFTKLAAPDDYTFLERFLDVTQSNLFFARGVIFVEGWSEEILIPALARKMKAKGLLQKNLTEAGVSVVNLRTTAFERYAKIFLRNATPPMVIPVALVRDLDIPEYERVSQPQSNSTPEASEGAADACCVKIVSPELQTKKSTRTAGLVDLLNTAPVRTFVAPHWTLEYSVLKSPSIGGLFTAAFYRSHPRADRSDPEGALALKLLKRTLDKTEIAYDLALRIDAAGQQPSDGVAVPDITLNQSDEGVTYLMDAIKYACRS